MIKLHLKREVIIVDAFTIKHRQHYVFQAYLKSWANKDQIWCCRNRTKCFPTNVLNIAQERDFYRIKDLNADEEKFVMLFLYKQPREIQVTVQKQMKIFQKPLHWQKALTTVISAIKASVYKDKTPPPEIEDLFLQADKFAESTVNDMVEDLYSEDEAEFITMIEALKAGNTDFYYHPYHKPEMVFDNSKRAFLSYLCSQHYRTKAARKRLVDGLNEMLKSDMFSKLGINKDKIRPDHVAFQIFWFIEGLLADALYERNAHLSILNNQTCTPFLTTDQPVINILADYQDITDMPNDIILYYPLSPTTAITVNDANEECYVGLTEAQVERYNNMLTAASFELIFSNSKETVERYASNSKGV